jgi:hypothetical protein
MNPCKGRRTAFLQFKRLYETIVPLAVNVNGSFRDANIAAIARSAVIAAARKPDGKIRLRTMIGGTTVPPNPFQKM